MRRDPPFSIVRRVAHDGIGWALRAVRHVGIDRWHVGFVDGLLIWIQSIARLVAWEGATACGKMGGILRTDGDSDVAAVKLRRCCVRARVHFGQGWEGLESGTAFLAVGLGGEVEGVGASLLHGSLSALVKPKGHNTDDSKSNGRTDGDSNDLVQLLGRTWTFRSVEGASRWSDE